MTAQRSDWVDSAKGLGIVLVVSGHAVVGLRDANLLPPDHWLQTANYLVYTFHMPLFFLLGGLFVPRRLETSARPFLQGLPARLLYPYFLWSVVQLTFIHLAGSTVNHPAPLTAERVLALAWQPTSQYWYLHALFLMHVVSALLYRRVWVFGLFVVALVALGSKDLLGLPEVINSFCRFFIFYVCGVALGEHLSRGEAQRVGPGITTIAAVGWLLLGLTALDHGVGYWDVAALPAAYAGALACVGLAHTAPVRASPVIRYLGRHSMPIFLLHVLFTAGGRIALHDLAGLRDGVLLYGLLLALGIAGPLMVFEAARRLRLSRPLGFEA